MCGAAARVMERGDPPAGVKHWERREDELFRGDTLCAF